MEKFESIPLDILMVSPTNPRKHFTEESLNEMAQSLKNVGLIEPLVVRYAIGTINDRYEIVCGERRYRSAVIAGLKTLDCIIKDLNDDQVFEIQINENLHREDVYPLDEAEAFHSLMQRKHLSFEDLALRFGKSEEYIFGRMRLINLCSLAKKYLEDGILPVTAAIKISTLPENQQKDALHRTIITQDVDDQKVTSFIGLKELKSFFENNILMPLKAADFDITDKKLCPEAGPCSQCAKRTGHGLFKDFIDSDKCLDSICYRKKQVEHYKKLKETLSKKVKAEIFFCARSYGGEKDYGDLGKILSIVQYDNSFSKDETDANAYGIFIGANRHNFHENNLKVEHGWIKINTNSITPEKKESPELSKQIQVENDLTRLKDQFFKKEMFDQFKLIHSKAVHPLSMTILCATLLDETPMLNSILLDLIVRYEMVLMVGNGKELNWKTSILSEEDHISTSYQECLEAVSNVNVKKLPMLLNELVFIRSLNIDDELQGFVNTFELDLKAAQKISVKQAKDKIKQITY